MKKQEHTPNLLNQWILFQWTHMDPPGAMIYILPLLQCNCTAFVYIGPSVVFGSRYSEIILQLDSPLRNKINYIIHYALYDNALQRLLRP